ncbi:MAG: tetratricopeptide repeat protein [Pseudomonadota bacterium]
MFWVVAALVTAAVCIVVIAPFKRAPRLSTALMVLIPVATMGLYLWWGNSDMPDQPLASRDQMALQQHNQALAAADQLARQLADDPQNLEGWALLGQTWSALGRHGDAAQAFGRAAALAPERPALAIAQVEAMIAVEDGLMTVEASRIVDRLNRDHPDLPGAQFYRGLQRWQAGAMDEAVAVWQALRREARGDEAWLPSLNRRLAAAQALSGS